MVASRGTPVVIACNMECRERYSETQWEECGSRRNDGRKKNDLSLVKCLVCSHCYTFYIHCNVALTGEYLRGKEKKWKLSRDRAQGAWRIRTQIIRCEQAWGGNLVREMKQEVWKCVLYGGVETIHATWNQIIANPTQNYLLWMVIGSNSELQCFAETRGLKNKLWKLFRVQELEDRDQEKE